MTTSYGHVIPPLCAEFILIHYAVTFVTSSIIARIFRVHPQSYGIILLLSLIGLGASVASSLLWHLLGPRGMYAAFYVYEIFYIDYNLNPWYTGAPELMISYIGPLASSYFLLRWERLRWLRIHSPICRKCGYDLTGNQSGYCSECGLKISKKKLKMIAASPSQIVGRESIRSKTSGKDN